MVSRGERSSNKIYAAIAIFVIIIIIFTFLFGGNQIIEAYIESKYLESNGWFDSGVRQEPNERLFGLEKQISFKYEVEKDDDNHPAFLTVTTIKTLFMMSEEELLEKTVETINNAAEEENIVLDNESEYTGWRVLSNGHKTHYITYNGTDISTNTTEDIVIIGETWNCAMSGTSIICIGFAQLTDNASGNTNKNYTHLAEIVGDKEGTFVNRFNSFEFIKSDGLIFNVKCH